jgi:hypothetical protein
MFPYVYVFEVGVPDITGDVVTIGGMWVVDGVLQRFNRSKIECVRRENTCREASAYEFLPGESSSFPIVSWDKNGLTFREDALCASTIYRVEFDKNSRTPVYGQRTNKTMQDDPMCGTGPFGGPNASAGKIITLSIPAQDEASKLFMQEQQKRQSMPWRLYLALFLVVVWTILLCYRRRFSIRYVSAAKATAVAADMSLAATSSSS